MSIGPANTIETKPFTLEQEFSGGGPGCGSILQVKLDYQLEQLALFINSDITDDESDTLVFAISKNEKWRKLIEEFLTSSFIQENYEFDARSGSGFWPNEISIKKGNGIIAEIACLALAGHPFTRIAQELVSLSDDGLLQLRKSQGSLISRGWLWKVIRIGRVLEECDLDYSDLFNAYKTLNYKNVKIRKLWKELLKEAFLILEDRVSVDDDEFEETIDPFRDEIADTVQVWKQLNPLRSAFENMARRPKIFSLIQLIELSILNNGKLPTGKHLLKDHQNQNFEVDFDVLKELASDLKKNNGALL
ncbi:hypothetical protein N8199_08775 [Emcibacteraceae bacterium]|nr:hypothetical protein [Emcibacteraceae bacterium]